MAEASSPSASSMRPWSSNTLAAWSSSNGLASTRETRCRVQDRPNSATVEQSKSNYPSTMAMTRSSRHAAPDFFNSLLARLAQRWPPHLRGRLRLRWRRQKLAEMTAWRGPVALWASGEGPLRGRTDISGLRLEGEFLTPFGL